MFTTFLALIGLLFGLGGLALGCYATFRAREAQGDYRALAQRALAVNAAGADPRAVRDIAVLHYDALEEMSGARSFSLALLNSLGDGVVVTSINGRTESRTYAKAVNRGESHILLSPEEYRVVRSARLGNGIGAATPDPEPRSEVRPEPAPEANAESVPESDPDAPATASPDPEEQSVTVVPGPARSADDTAGTPTEGPDAEGAVEDRPEKDGTGEAETADPEASGAAETPETEGGDSHARPPEPREPDADVPDAETSDPRH
ncbi:DUF4446 family protein [Nocardiopsis sp. MG754419]|uniref:DUF4446 family protein n=1 Tax=Nocardiopsis sp. MG754419 TaxID=2259865 RepID=UPI001BA63E51|nr:DUF4446 domain-containing protein [Nocardiopsis sp. MG754419]